MLIVKKFGGASVGNAERVQSVANRIAKEYRKGSVGIPYSDTFYKIVEPGTAKELPANTDGEICISGPSVMNGYLDNKEETDKVLKRHEDGLVWLHTGDLAKIDKDGYIFISGRKKFVIVLKNGKNIYPEELEILLNKIEGVKESFVYGKPEDDGDYKICAKLVYDPETVKEKYNEEDEDKIQEALWQEVKKVNKTMPAYKYIREIKVTTKDFIKTTTQKIKRQEEMKNI